MFKIQIEGLYGWFDLKTSYDGHFYQVEVFETEEDAKSEAMFDIDDGGENWRVMPVNVPEDWSPYCD